MQQQQQHPLPRRRQPPLATVSRPPTSFAAGDPAKGKEYFTVCAGCHGMDGKGITGLGKDFATSEFVRSQTDTSSFWPSSRWAGRPATR